MLRIKSLAIAFGLSLCSAALIASEQAVPANAGRWLRVLESRPDHPRAIREVIQICGDAGAMPALIDHLTRRAVDSPDSALALANVLIANGETEQAVKILTGHTVGDTIDPRFSAALGRFLQGRGDASAAAKAYEIAATQSEGSARLDYLLAASDAWQAAGDETASNTAIQQALVAAPESLDLRRRLVERATANGSKSEAFEHLTWISANGPPSDQFDALVRIADIHEGADDLDQAIVQTRAALDRIGPTHFRRGELELRLLDLHTRAGTVDVLAAGVEQALTSGGATPGQWQFLANIRRARGDHTGNRDAIRRAYSMDPVNESLARELAELESNLGNHTEANKIANAQLKRRPQDPEWTFLLAQLKVRGDDAPAAHALLDQLVLEHGDDQTLQTRIRRFYESNNMLTELHGLILRADSPLSGGATIPAILDKRDRNPAMLDVLATKAETSPVEAADAANIALLAGAIWERGDQARALALSDRALSSAPTNSEVVRIAIALRVGSGEINEATRLVDDAVVTDPSLIDSVDYHLFQLLSAARSDSQLDETTASSLVADLMNTMSPGTKSVPYLSQREIELQSRWESSRTPVDALRLARWQSWRGNPEAAAATVLLASRQDPENVPLLEFQLDIALRSNDQRRAMDTIENLRSLQPERQAEFESHLATIYLDREDFNQALTIYETLTRQNPENAEAWMNLASAQQRSGNYYNALQSWTTAYTTAKPAEKKQIRSPIMAVIERLRLWDRGIDFLVNFALEQPSEADAIASFDEAIAFALAHDGADHLAKRLTQEQTEGRNPAAIMVARAELARATGDSAGALRHLSRATQRTGDRVSVWNKLLDSAVSSGDAGRAVLAATAITQESDTPEAWIRLAETQETLGTAREAHETWSVIRNRFNRSVHALEAAAAYFERSGKSEDAIVSRLTAAQLEGTRPTAILRAIDDCVASGNRQLAIELCDRLLAETLPSDTVSALPGASETDPVAERRGFNIAMRALGGLSDPQSLAILRQSADQSSQEDTDANARLAAIRIRGQLSTGGDERTVWTAWTEQARSPLEAVWAAYSMGYTAMALALLENNSDTLNNAEPTFSWIAIRGHHFTELRDWIEASPDDRRRRSELMFLALSRYLLDTPADMAGLSELFPLDESTLSERWQAAWMLAAHGDFRAAADLAWPALSLTPPRFVATGAQTLASWFLVLREPERALQVLQSVQGRTRLGLDQPAFHAWRMRWLLESEEGRTRMANEIENSPDPLFAAACLAIDAALSYDAERTREDARNLTAMWLQFLPPHPGEESFETTLRTSVAAAQGWNLPVLAYELAMAASEMDQARVALLDGTNPSWKSELAIMALTSRLQVTPPAEIPYFLAEFNTIRLDSPTLSSLARQLAASGHAGAAAALRTKLLEDFPDDPGILNELVVTARQQGDTDAEILALEKTLALRPPTLPFSTLSDSAIRLAELRMAADQPDAALNLIESIRAFAPSDPRLVSAADSAMKELGMHSGRADLWEQQTLYFPAAASQWVEALSDAGRVDEISSLAARWMEEGRPFDPSLTASLAIAFASTNSNASYVMLQRLCREGFWTLAAEAAPSLKGTLLESEVVRLMNEAVVKAAQPGDRLACVNAVISLVSPAITPELASTLSDVASKAETAAPEHAGITQNTELKIFEENPSLDAWLDQRLAMRSRHGPSSHAAIATRIQRALSGGNPESAAEAAAGIRNATSWTEADLVAVAEDLGKAGIHSESARIFEILHAANPANQRHLFAAATQHWHAGEGPRAEALIAPFVQMRFFDPVLHRYLAAYFRDTGRNTEAMIVLSEIVSVDPAVTHPTAWAELANLHAIAGDPENASNFLNAAVASPGFRDAHVLVDTLAPGKPVHTIRPEDIPAGISDRLRTEVHLEILRRLLATDPMAKPNAIASWINKDLFKHPEGRDMMTRVAQSPDGAAKLAPVWIEVMSEQPTTRSRQSAYADFLQLRASHAENDGRPSEAAEFFEQSATAAPWRLSIVEPHVRQLTAAGRTREGILALERLLSSAPNHADRMHAQAMIARLQKSDDLLPASEGS